MARKTCGNIRGTVYPIRNRFFGETITVSGLVTGGDLLEQLRGRDLGERLLLPSSMLRAGEDVFLDDVTVEQVEATDFLRMGGRCRRVMTMPGRSSYQAMRYSGQFQLDRSAAELVRMEAVVPVLFYGKPGDLVRIQRSDWDRNGSWRVVEASVQADEAGGRTRLELAVPDVVI